MLVLTIYVTRLCQVSGSFMLVHICTLCVSFMLISLSTGRHSWMLSCKSLTKSPLTFLFQDSQQHCSISIRRNSWKLLFPQHFNISSFLTGHSEAIVLWRVFHLQHCLIEILQHGTIVMSSFDFSDCCVLLWEVRITFTVQGMELR